VGGQPGRHGYQPADQILLIDTGVRTAPACVADQLAVGTNQDELGERTGCFDGHDNGTNAGAYGFYVHDDEFGTQPVGLPR